MEPPIVPNFPGAGAGAGAGAGEGNGGVDGGVVAPPSDRVAGVDFPGAGESTPAARGDFPGGVGSGVPGGAPTTEGGPPAGGTESAAHSGAEVGRYVSDQQVLMRLDPASGRWNLVPSRGTLAVGDRLLSLPTYRPQITLASGVQVTLVGPAAVTVIAPGPDGTPYLQVDYGRLLVLTIGRPGTRLGLKLGQVTGMVSFGDPDATMAISVEQLRVSGVQPKSAETHTKVTLMPTSGSLGWQRGSSELEKLDAGVKHVIFDELAGGTVESGPLPGWIDGSDLPKIDQRASRDLMPALGEDRPPVLVLRERSEDRRVEIRSLAARCLSYMDEFDPLVSALRDDQQRSSWTAFFGAIQNALARGEKSSAALRDSMLKVRGEVGEELYRLTWGFNNEQLKEGGAARLVELLDHEEMDVRVLAFENLVQITGKTLLYRPEYNSAQRKRYIRPWSEKLDAGEIAWQQPPPSAKLPAPAPGGGTPGGDRPATIPPR